MKEEILRDVKKMKLEQAVKVLVNREKIIRVKFERMKNNLRLFTETTFSDLQENNIKSFFAEEFRDIQKNIETYNELRQILRKRYDDEIRKGQRGNGLKVIRKFGINFIFPNIKNSSP